MEFLDIYSSDGVLICGILCPCYLSTDILDVFQSINNFDIEVQHVYNIQINKEYKKARVYIMLTFAVTIIYSFATVLVTVYGTGVDSEKHFGTLVFLTVPATLNTFIDYQFCVLLLSLKQRFLWLNKDVAYGVKMLDRRQPKKLRPLSFAVSNGFLQDIVWFRLGYTRVRHLQLCTICKRCNNAFSIQILFAITQSFVTIVIVVIYTGRHIFVDKDVIIQYIVYAFLQMSLSSLQVIFVVIICSITAEEASKSGPLIHKLLYLQGKTKLKKELSLEILHFSTQFFHYKVVFSAGRLFKINENLLFTIAGAITTYLIVVIQFDVAPFSM